MLSHWLLRLVVKFQFLFTQRLLDEISRIRDMFWSLTFSYIYLTNLTAIGFIPKHFRITLHKQSANQKAKLLCNESSVVDVILKGSFDCILIENVIGRENRHWCSRRWHLAKRPSWQPFSRCSKYMNQSTITLCT